MARMARVVIPEIPHHVVQRGVRSLDVFQCEDDYRNYITLLAKACRAAGTQVWAYCLMSNHVHLILLPLSESGLRTPLGETHRQYTRQINFRMGCRGHLWQERFHSFPMNEAYLLAAVRYVEMNPVRAHLVSSPEAYPWSSARAHLAGKNDQLVDVAPMLDRVENWRAYLGYEVEQATKENFRLHGRTGRPLGDELFLQQMENLTGYQLHPMRPGRKLK
ncbi:MAG: transposase [Mariprofundus sp.]|nr:transposase [Mariprofundus sp.]